MRRPSLIVSIAMLVVGVGCALAVQAADETTDNTEQVKIKGPFKETWVRPDMDITRYSKIYPWKTVFQFRDEGTDKGAPTTAGRVRGDDGPYVVKDEGKQKFEEIVTAEFIKELGRSKVFELVDEVGPDTLLVRALVLDIVSNVPPNYVGTADVHLSAVGEASFVFELIDAETGVVQATVGERRLIQPPNRMYDINTAPANSATILNDVKVWATSVARDLRVAMEKAQKRQEKASK